MAEFHIHRPNMIRATARHHEHVVGGTPFTCLTIVTDQGNVALYLPAERAAWAESVVAAINAPASQPVEVAA
jgi:hypothetical protein